MSGADAARPRMSHRESLSQAMLIIRVIREDEMVGPTQFEMMGSALSFLESVMQFRFPDEPRPERDPARPQDELL